MSDFQNSEAFTRVNAISKSADFETDAALDLNIGAAARVARKTHDDIHHAMFTGAMPCHRDRDGRRVVKLGDLLAWMRSAQSGERRRVVPTQ